MLSEAQLRDIRADVRSQIIREQTYMPQLVAAGQLQSTHLCAWREAATRQCDEL